MGDNKIRIGLTMIVKNEAHCIGRCLESVFKSGLIDYFRIVDTGSSDDTKGVIKKAFAINGVSGDIVAHPFTNFADCRNVALQGLEDFCDYALWIDADEVLTLKEPNSAEIIKEKLSKFDAGLVEAIDGNTAFYRTTFFKLSPEIKWVGRVHEYVAGVSPSNITIIDDCHIDVYKEGASWKGSLKNKLKRYLELLIEQRKEEPNEPRWTYFIADTYRNIQEPQYNELAMEWYAARISMKSGNVEEIYASKLMLASMQLNKTGSINRPLLESCNEVDRGEHLLTLSVYYQKTKHVSQSYHYSKQMVKYFGAIPKEASLMIDKMVYFYTMPLVHAYNCYLLGFAEEAKAAMEFVDKYVEVFGTYNDKSQATSLRNGINNLPPTEK